MLPTQRRREAEIVQLSVQSGPVLQGGSGSQGLVTLRSAVGRLSSFSLVRGGFNQFDCSRLCGNMSILRRSAG